MLSHENLTSYYKDNSALLWKKKGNFEQNMTLTELEEMMPWERTGYLILIDQRIEELKQEQAANKGKK